MKTYIEIHFKTRFIQFSKSFVTTFILFNKKFNDNFYLYINYWGLNNLTIKNYYLFLLISKALDCIGWVK